MIKRFFALPLVVLSVQASAQSVLPQLRMDKTGTEKQISVRDPQAGVDVLFGSILNGSVLPPRAPIYNNPSIAGGLFGLPDTISQTNILERHNFTGTRTTKSMIGHTIAMSDGATGPQSGPATASYGLSIYQERPNWNTSSITGEMDGLNITLRQANGDAAAILSNILTRSGFGATIESYTGSADATGATTKAINTQLGVSNSRDNSHYGLVVQAAVGANLNAGIRINEITGSNFVNAIEFGSDAAGLKAYIRAADGAFIGGSLVPIANRGANIGAPSVMYANIYTRNMVLDMQIYATLGACNSGTNGTLAYISDASAAITTWGQIVTAGGGSARAYLTCDGTNWRAFSL